MFFQDADKKRIWIYTFPFVCVTISDWRLVIFQQCVSFIFTEVFGLWTSEWAISRLQDHDKVPAIHPGEPWQYLRLNGITSCEDCCHCCTTYLNNTVSTSWTCKHQTKNTPNQPKKHFPITSRHFIQSNLPHLSHLPRSRMCPRDSDIVNLEHGAHHDGFTMAVMWLDQHRLHGLPCRCFPWHE